MVGVFTTTHIVEAGANDCRVVCAPRRKAPIPKAMDSTLDLIVAEHEDLMEEMQSLEVHRRVAAWI